MKKRLAIDLDGIVIDYIPVFAREIARKHNPLIKEKDLHNDIYVEEYFGVTRKQMDDILKEHVKEGILEWIHPIPDAINYIKKLMDGGYSIRYVTSRREDAREQTENWLKRYRIENKLIIVKGNKGNEVTKHNTDFFIDDDPRYHRQVSSDVEKLLLDKPYNQKFTGADRFVNWKDMYNHITNENKRLDILLRSFL